MLDGSGLMYQELVNTFEAKVIQLAKSIKPSKEDKQKAKSNIFVFLKLISVF